MAVTVSIYNHTAAKFADGSNAVGDTYKLELLNSSASFTAADTQKTQVDNAGAYETYGSGWAQGGVTLGSVAVTTVTTNDAKFAAADISVTATGGDIGPATAALLYNSTDANGPPLAFIDFGGAKTAGVGTDFKVTWNASGIFTFTVT
jgi:hypothetical protein